MQKVTIIVLVGLALILPFNANAQTIIKPIIIVPGIMGSWNSDVILSNKTGEGVWSFFPLDHTWDKFITNLQLDGYEIDKTLFVAFYDWRQSNINSAIDYLIPTIDKALANSSSTKVDVIAHSMGGLVTRRYIQSSQYRGDIDQIVMLGTPNYGSSDVFTLWEGGLIPKNWDVGTRVFANNVIDILNIKDVTTDDEYDTVHKYIPSIQELLPTYDFLTDSGGNTKPYSTLLEATNPFLDNLNDPSNMSNLLELGHITVIAGTGTSTVNTIPTTGRSSSETKLWVDGMPDPINPLRNDTTGDNRVLLSSAFLDKSALIGPVLSQEKKNFWRRLLASLVPFTQAQSSDDIDALIDLIEIDSTHGGLPSVAIPEVFLALGLSNPVGDFEPPAEPNNITTFWFASPVAVKITDPQGGVITKDSNNIPGAVYTGETDLNGVKMVIIPDGLSGEYGVELTGTGNGEYHIGISSFTDTNDNTVIVQKSVVTGEVIKYTTTINNEIGVVEEVSEPVIAMPGDEEPPVEKSAIELTKELISDLEKYYKDGGIKNKGIYQSLQNDLRVVLAALKEIELIRPIGEKYPKLHELKVRIAKKLALNKLEAFIAQVERQMKKNKITELAAEDLISQAKVIITKID